MSFSFFSTSFLLLSNISLYADGCIVSQVSLKLIYIAPNETLSSTRFAVLSRNVSYTSLMCSPPSNALALIALMQLMSMFAVEADADVTGNPFIYMCVCVCVCRNPCPLVACSPLKTMPRRSWRRLRSGGRQLAVLWPNGGSNCNCWKGRNVFVVTWQCFKPKSFRTKPAHKHTHFYACILSAAIEMQVASTPPLRPTSAHTL